MNPRSRMCTWPAVSCLLPMTSGGLELQLHCELQLAWHVVWIGSSKCAEGCVAKLRASVATVVINEPIGGVGDVKGLDAELQIKFLREREGLDEGYIEVAEVRSEERVALRGADGSDGLRGERCGVEELRERLVGEMRVADQVGAIVATVVLRSGAIAVRLGLTVVGADGCVNTVAAVDDAEGLAALPGGDQIGGPDRMPVGRDEPGTQDSTVADISRLPVAGTECRVLGCSGYGQGLKLPRDTGKLGRGFGWMMR